ncbi:alpha/beta fold hydrolase [Paraburkholderia sp. 1N]|uniref:Alpha/beta fold hydrolase n=1 Tax=Paraburkholderia solitsugae TaxID=2675748 RepID=A0ABX2C3Y9_9BURK|nr:alpha/beta hydrolase [Paraburkholderia solitsugae]NPT46958.1 alpha/beta fold hydrolase [Paraburkholderia solitsugae]
MASIPITDGQLHYEVQGAGAETIVFLHGMLWDRHLFDAQVAALQSRYRCVCADLRGHGRSSTVSDCDLYTQTDDIADLIQALGGEACHIVGQSMGGFVALRLALRYPALVKSLTLIGSSAEAPTANDLRMSGILVFVVRWFGIRPVAGKVMDICLGDKFLADPARAVLRQEIRQRILDNDVAVLLRTAMAVNARDDLSHELHRITVPTLVMVGSNDKDSQTTPAHAQRLHAKIPGSRLVVVPAAGHFLPIEEPEAVNLALIDFLATSFL